MGIIRTLPECSYYFRNNLTKDDKYARINRSSFKGEEMTVKENEFGDKIGKSDICAGILFWIGVAAMAACACGVVVKKVGNHKAQTTEKAKVIQIQNQR